MEKKESTLRREQEDFILSRILLWFGSAVVLEFFLLMVNRFYFNYRSDEIYIMAALHQVLYALIFVGAALFVVGAVWMALSWQRGKLSLAPIAVTVVSLAVGVCSFVVRIFQSAGMQLLQIAVPMIAVLALVYYLYQREFFWITTVGVLNVFGLWLCRKASGDQMMMVYCYAVVLAVVLVGMLVCTKKAVGNHGVLTAGNLSVRLLNTNGSGTGMYLTCGVAALSMIGAIAFGAMVAYGALFAVVAWIFALAVFHTVKLM